MVTLDGVTSSAPKPVHVHVWRAPKALPEVQECHCGALRATPRPSWLRRDVD